MKRLSCCYLWSSFCRAVESWAPQEQVNFLPRLPTHLLHVQIPLDLRTAAGRQEVLKEGGGERQGAGGQHANVSDSFTRWPAPSRSLGRTTPGHMWGRSVSVTAGYWELRQTPSAEASQTGGNCFLSNNTLSSGLLASVTDIKTDSWWLRWAAAWILTQHGSRHRTARHCAIDCKINRGPVIVLCMHRYTTSQAIYSFIFYFKDKKVRKKRKKKSSECHVMQCVCQDIYSSLHTLNQHTAHSFWEALKPKLSCGCLKYLEFAVSMFHKNITPWSGRLSY